MRLAFICLATILIFSSLALAFDPNDAWHPLGQITTTPTSMVSVDSNNDGIIDSAAYAAYATTAGSANNLAPSASVPWTSITGKPAGLDNGDTRCDVSGLCSQVCIGSDCRNAWPTTSSLAWTSITGKPTTISGYGITDMASQSVNYAASAGNADMLDGLHASQLGGTLQTTTVTCSVNGGCGNGCAATCPSGYTVVGGGGDAFTAPYAQLQRSFPSGNGWYCYGSVDYNLPCNLGAVTCYAVCAKIA